MPWWVEWSAWARRSAVLKATYKTPAVCANSEPKLPFFLFFKWKPNMPNYTPYVNQVQPTSLKAEVSNVCFWGADLLTTRIKNTKQAQWHSSNNFFRWFIPLLSHSDSCHCPVGPDLPQPHPSRVCLHGRPQGPAGAWQITSSWTVPGRHNL